MKYKVLFYQQNNEKNSRLSSAAVLIGALRVTTIPALNTFKSQLFLPCEATQKMIKKTFGSTNHSVLCMLQSDFLCSKIYPIYLLIRWGFPVSRMIAIN